MQQRILISLLGFLLVFQAMSPLCHAVGAAFGADPLPAPSAPALSTTPTSDSPADTHTPETCWFQAAHLFQSGAVQSGHPGFPTVVVLALVTIALAITLPRQTLVRYWKLPDRSPPSQPLLQIFRI